MEIQFQKIQENCEEQDKFSGDCDANFPFSFCEVSMEKKNQQLFTSSFEEIQSIRRRSVDQQSDFNDNNSTIMYFLASPSSLKQGPLFFSKSSNGREESTTPTSLQQIESQQSNRFIQETIKEVSHFDQDENYSSFVQKAVNCINRNKVMPSNVYNYNLEEYKQTQRKFRREVEQIIESSEISSEIEQNLFFDSDQDEDEKDDSRENLKRKQNQNKNLKGDQNQSQKIPYNSDSDSLNSDESQDQSCNRKSQQQKSYSKSLNSKILTPNMCRSTTDDDCKQNKKRIIKSKSKSQLIQKNQISESVLNHIQTNNSCCLLQERKEQSISSKHNNSDIILQNDLSLNQNSNASKCSSKGESTNTIFHKSDDGQQERIINKSSVLKDISFQSQNSKSRRPPTIQISKTFNNQQQNIILINQ